MELQDRDRKRFFTQRCELGRRRVRGNRARALGILTLAVMWVGAPIAQASATTRAQSSAAITRNSEGGSDVTSKEGTVGSAGITLAISVVSFTVTVGGTVSPTASVDSGLASNDTATVTGATFTYAGTGTTVYALSTTAPTAIGTYSVNPSKATVTISPSTDAANYSNSYIYIAGSLTIRAAVVVPTPRAVQVIGHAIVGERRTLIIRGLNFSANPRVTSNGPGAEVLMSSKSATRIVVSVIVRNAGRSGTHLFTITTSAGKTCKIGYLTSRRPAGLT